MPKKEDDSQNPTKIFYYNYWIYVFTGFWKYKSLDKWKIFLFKVYQSTLAFVYFVTLILFTVDAYAVRNDLEKFSFNMSSTVLVFITLLKISIMRFKRRLTENLIDQLNNNFYSEDHEENKIILVEKAKSITLITKLFYSVLGVIYPLRVLAATALDSKSYIIPMPYPDKVESYYRFIYTYQVLITSHFLMTVTAHDMFLYGIIIRLIANYEIIEKNILNIKYLYPNTDFEKLVPGYRDGYKENTQIPELLMADNPWIRVGAFKFGKVKNKKVREEKVFEMLKECVRHHQALLKGIKNFLKIYGFPLLIQAMGAVSLIGIVALHILFLSTEVNFLLIQQILYVGTTSMNILYLCTFGSDITIKSEAVAAALYDLPWYQMSIKNQKTIHFIMKKFLDGPKMRGGNMVIINRVTYLKFLQLSYNMVAVLKNTY